MTNELNAANSNLLMWNVVQCERAPTVSYEYFRGDSRINRSFVLFWFRFVWCVWRTSCCSCCCGFVCVCEFACFFVLFCLCAVGGFMVSPIPCLHWHANSCSLLLRATRRDLPIMCCSIWCGRQEYQKHKGLPLNLTCHMFHFFFVNCNVTVKCLNFIVTY